MDIEELGCEGLTAADRVEHVREITTISPWDEYEGAESDFVIDLLTNIRHFCDAEGVCFQDANAAASAHYHNEANN